MGRGEIKRELGFGEGDMSITRLIRYLFRGERNLGASFARSLLRLRGSSFCVSPDQTGGRRGLEGGGVLGDCWRVGRCRGGFLT